MDDRRRALGDAGGAGKADEERSRRGAAHQRADRPQPLGDAGGAEAVGLAIERERRAARLRQSIVADDHADARRLPLQRVARLERKRGHRGAAAERRRIVPGRAGRDAARGDRVVLEQPGPFIGADRGERGAVPTKVKRAVRSEGAPAAKSWAGVRPMAAVR